MAHQSRRGPPKELDFRYPTSRDPQSRDPSARHIELRDPVNGPLPHDGGQESDVSDSEGALNNPQPRGAPHGLTGWSSQLPPQPRDDGREDIGLTASQIQHWICYQWYNDDEEAKTERQGGL